MSNEKQVRSGRWWRRYRVVPRVEQRTVGSRWLYRVDHYSSLPVVAGVVGAMLICAFIVGIVLRFPNGWIVAETMKRVEEGQRDLKRQTGVDEHSRAPDVVAGRG